MINTESYFPDEELPTRAGLQVLRTTDPDYGLSTDEIQDRYEFIRCYLKQELEPLTQIQTKGSIRDFFVTDYLNSAFNTHDFWRTHRLFKKSNGAMDQLRSRIKELATMHSCISVPEGRHQVLKQFDNCLACTFQWDLEALAAKLHHATAAEKYRVKQQIARIQSNIFECRRIWAQYAPPEQWEP